MTETTPEEVQPGAGVEETQPVDTEQTTAETPEPEATDKSEEAEPSTDDNPEPEFDAQAWLQKKGLDPTDPETINKLAKAQHAAEQKMHEATSKASELKKSLDNQPVDQRSQDPLVQQLYEDHLALKRDTAINNFKRDVRLTPDQEMKMVKYITDHKEKGQLVNLGYITLEEIYTLSGAGSVDPNAIEERAKQKTLQQLANKQMATAVNGAATKHTTPSTPEERLKELWSS